MASTASAGWWSDRDCVGAGTEGYQHKGPRSDGSEEQSTGRHWVEIGSRSNTRVRVQVDGGDSADALRFTPVHVTEAVRHDVASTEEEG